MKWLMACAPLLFVTGCSPDVSDPTAPEAASVPLSGAAPETTRTPARIEITGLPSISMIGYRYTGGVYARAGDESWIVQSPVEWSSSDAAVAVFESPPPGWPAVGALRVVGPGTATLTASAMGLSASIELEAVSFSEAWGPTSLVIDSITVVEFSYSDDPGAQRFYAPRLAVRDTTGAGAVVFGFQMTLPGIGSTPWCGSVRPVHANQSAQVFVETYGDYDLTFDRPGQRADPGDASAVVYVRAADGTAGTHRLMVPVVPGGLPTTYSGGPLVPWSCGF